MSNIKRTRYALIYSAIIGVVLVLSAYLPEWSRPKQFPFLLGEGTPSRRVEFPLEKPFRTLNSAPTRELELGKVLNSEESYALVNFWATWCPPCIDEMPSLEHLHRALTAGKLQTAKRLRVVAISVDENAAEVPKLLKTLDFRATFTILHDPKAGFAKSLGIEKFPETVLVDSKGWIVHKFVGPQDWMGADTLETLGMFLNP